MSQEQTIGIKCSKTLTCGHACGGVADETTCLPCLQGCGSTIKGSATVCAICYTEELTKAPAIQLWCGHVYHKHCCDSQIEKRWTGPRITFRFLRCPICEDVFMSHPSLPGAKPMLDLYDTVQAKALARLDYEKETGNAAVTDTGSKFYKRPSLYAMDRYAYYLCHRCQKPYYGGGGQCAVQIEASADYNPEELVCAECSSVSSARVENCPTHGTDYIAFKCRYCCSLAVYFCFGTTHFCTPCHTDHGHVTGMSKDALPSCPAGPKAQQLSGACPLQMDHPPSGEEFALGCGVCHNILTF